MPMRGRADPALACSGRRRNQYRRHARWSRQEAAAAGGWEPAVGGWSADGTGVGIRSMVAWQEGYGSWGGDSPGGGSRWLGEPAHQADAGSGSGEGWQTESTADLVRSAAGRLLQRPTSTSSTRTCAAGADQRRARSADAGLGSGGRLQRGDEAGGLTAEPTKVMAASSTYTRRRRILRQPVAGQSTGRRRQTRTRLSAPGAGGSDQAAAYGNQAMRHAGYTPE